jgi:hypothetical protein
MNTEHPHELTEQLPHGDDGRHWLPITALEHAKLSLMTAEERAAWLAAIPTKERLGRVLEREGLPVLASMARLGRFDDYDEGGLELPQVELVCALRDRGRNDLAQRVVDGEWDATSAESDAWAARQTGETAAMLDKMKLRLGQQSKRKRWN